MHTPPKLRATRTSHRRIAPVAFGCLTLACANPDAALRLGVAGDFGDHYGQMSRRGVDLAVTHINADGGIRGRPLGIVAVDDSGTATGAVAAASALVANPSVVAVVGHINSATTLAASVVYDRHIAAISPTASSPDLSGASSWVFRTVASDSVNGAVIARQLASLSVKEVAVLYENTAYGRGLAQSFERSLGRPVLLMDPIGAGADQNLEPHVALLRRHKPHALFVAGASASGRALLKEAQRQGYRPLFVGGDGWVGVAADTSRSEGVLVATPFTPTDGTTGASSFVRAFRSKYGIDPDAPAALAYDATRLLATAIAATGGKRAAVRQWLDDLNEANAITGVSGPVWFDDRGDRVGSAVRFAEVRSGALQRRAGSGS